MITLEGIHKAMNNPQVQAAANTLYQEWMWKELDGLENDPVTLRHWAISTFRRLGYVPVTEDQLLAAEHIFQNKVEAKED